VILSRRIRLLGVRVSGLQRGLETDPAPPTRARRQVTAPTPRSRPPHANAPSTDTRQGLLPLFDASTPTAPTD
jgi:hypothetical protein